jgi:hypothetical protein
MSLTGAEAQLPSSAIFGGKEDNSFEQIALRIPIVRVLLQLDKTCSHHAAREKSPLPTRVPDRALGVVRLPSPRCFSNAGKVTVVSPWGSPPAL